MDLQIDINGRLRVVAIESRDGLYRVTIDGAAHLFDAAQVDPSTVSLIGVSDGRRSHEVGLAETGVVGETAAHMAAGVALARVLTGAGRYGRGSGAADQAEGAQRVTAPMPGKVVKLLVAVGDQVAARQGLIVVEAMKMENELRSPKAGRVVDVLVGEGMSVEAGRALVVVE